MPRKKKASTQIEQNGNEATAVAELPVKAKRNSRKEKSEKVQTEPVEVTLPASDTASTAIAADIPHTEHTTGVAEPQPAEHGPQASEPLSQAAVATQPSEQTPPASANEHERPRFRSWSLRKDVGYEKLTDQKRGLLVLKFAQKPSNELLATLKDVGFRYSPDYEDQGPAWLHRNDYQGRLQVEKIEMLLREPNQYGSPAQ